MHKHYWTIRPNLPSEGPSCDEIFPSNHEDNVGGAHTGTRLLLEVELFSVLVVVLYQVADCSYRAVSRHGYKMVSGKVYYRIEYNE